MRKLSLQLQERDQTFLSADMAIEQEDQSSYPTEYLNKLTPSGLPSHKLTLKVGCPIMLLRNVNPSIGMCNGVRLIVTDFRPHLIVAQIVDGPNKSKIVHIPRITTSTESPVSMNRRQFPIKLAFAMTINKSQGQSLERVGVFLPQPVFSHGQLYVALSRVKRPEGLHVLILNGEKAQLPGIFTKNIVYSQVLQKINQ